MNGDDFINRLGLMLQALSLEILFNDYNNTDLMRELQKQDTNYFEAIVRNQEEILSILKRKENDYERRNKKEID